MIKNLTLITVAGLFVNTGCIINTNPTETDSGTNDTVTNNTSTDGTTTDGTTTDGTTTSGTGTDTDSTATTGPTTTAPTTTEGTTDGTTDATTTEGTTDSTTAGTTGTSEFGKCGWDATNKYYACGMVGADPEGLSPIECPDPLPAEGDACNEDSPITGVGCCLPDGTNYYCSQGGMIVLEACGS